MIKPEKLELEIQKVIEIGKKKGELSMDEVAERFSKLNIDEVDEILNRIQEAGVNLIETTDIDKILKNIIDAQPTREMSVNDYPATKAYYTIEIDTVARQYRYFLYAENSQVYVELPYEGIYKTNQQFLDFVVNYFK